MKINMMMAMDKNGLIGHNGKLPWHLPQELRYFREVTMHKPIIMGSETFYSIGKPLSGRTNIVLTKSNAYFPECHAANSIEESIVTAKEYLNGGDECVVIGGASVCKQFLPLTDRLYLTRIDHEFHGDTWLDIDLNNWVEIDSRYHEKTETNQYPYKCGIYERIK